MDFLLCGYAAGRWGNGLPKRFSTVLAKTGIRADTAAAFAVAAPVQAPKKLPVEQYRVYAALREAPK